MSSSTMLRFLVGVGVFAAAWGVYSLYWVPPTMGPGSQTVVPDSGLTTEARSRHPFGEEDALAQFAALRREIALLKADFASLRQKLAAQPDPARAPAPQPTEDPEGLASSGQPANQAELRALEVAAAERDHQQSLARMQHYEAALQAEPVDGAWSSGAAAVLKEAFSSQELSATIVQDNECRATLCRVEVAHANPEDRRQFETQFTQKMAQALPSAVAHTEEQEDGSSVMTIYLARAGHELPQIEALQ